MWQKANRPAAAEKTVRKIEAEAIAFVVVQTIGLSTDRAGQAVLRTPSFLNRETVTHLMARC